MGGDERYVPVAGYVTFPTTFTLGAGPTSTFTRSRGTRRRMAEGTGVLAAAGGRGVAGYVAVATPRVRGV